MARLRRKQAAQGRVRRSGRVKRTARAEALIEDKREGSTRGTGTGLHIFTREGRMAAATAERIFDFPAGTPVELLSLELGTNDDEFIVLQLELCDAAGIPHPMAVATADGGALATDVNARMVRTEGNPYFDMKVDVTGRFKLVSSTSIRMPNGGRLVLVNRHQNAARKAALQALVRTL